MRDRLQPADRNRRATRWTSTSASAVALYPRDGDNPAALLANADAAL
jgi:hypothetical protein